MKGELYIDGVDVYEAYGVSVSDSAYDDLVCLPSLKPISFNDWQEQNGIDPDLSSPIIAAKSITLPFNIKGGKDSYYGFISSITDGAYHSFYFAAIGHTRVLRLVSSDDYDTIRDLGSFTLTFSDDDPMSGYVYVAPQSKVKPLGDFLLDGVDLASYGVRVMQGTMDSIKRAPDVKTNLSRDISVRKGVLYDGERVTFKSKTAQVKCFMRAAGAEEFWRNRNALLFDLVKMGSRILSVSELGKDIPCYYKGCSVDCFHPDKDKFWFEFTLNLEFYKGVI